MSVFSGQGEEKMKKVLKICVVVAVIAMTGTTMAALDINAPMSFTGIVDLSYPYYPPDAENGTQDGTMLSDFMGH